MKQSTSDAGHGPRRDGSREQFWRHAMRRFDASGQSVRAFCAGRGLSEASFYTWRRTLVARDAAPSPTAPAAAMPAFLPLRLVEGGTVTERGDEGVMEIVLAGGRCIRLRPPVDRAALVEVVAALEGSSSTDHSA